MISQTAGSDCCREIADRNSFARIPDQEAEPVQGTRILGRGTQP